MDKWKQMFYWILPCTNFQPLWLAHIFVYTILKVKNQSLKKEMEIHFWQIEKKSVNHSSRWATHKKKEWEICVVRNRKEMVSSKHIKVCALTEDTRPKTRQVKITDRSDIPAEIPMWQPQPVARWIGSGWRICVAEITAGNGWLEGWRCRTGERI